MGDTETKVLDRIDEDKVAAACSGEGVAVLIPCYNEAITIGKVVDVCSILQTKAVVHCATVCRHDISVWDVYR